MNIWRKSAAYWSLSIFATTFTVPSYAGYSRPGAVSGIYITNGIVRFNSSGDHVSAPACQSSAMPNAWVFDATTPQGQALLAVLLSAQAQGKRMAIGGSHNCGTSGDVEIVFGLTVE